MSRRIAAGVCALAVAVPAAASAMPPHDPPASQGANVTYGDTKYDLQNSQNLSAGGSYANQVSSLPADQLAAAYGTTKSDATPVTASVASSHDGTDGWRIAAVIEAGILAAFAVGAAVFLTGRQRRAPGMGT